MRKVLLASALGIVAIGLVGCNSDKKVIVTPPPPPAPAPVVTPAPAPAPVIKPDDRRDDDRRERDKVKK